MVASAKVLSAEISNGKLKNFDGVERIYYDGYWIRYYTANDTLARKKNDSLTSWLAEYFTTPNRVLTHRDPSLKKCVTAYENEENSARRRVLAAMLAGALLNRGVDILTKIVELEETGVAVNKDNELLKDCGRCFLGALEYGKYIRPTRAKEGLEELWGEPFKAFTMSMDEFYQTRYIKLAQTMRDIDLVSKILSDLFSDGK